MLSLPQQEAEELEACCSKYELISAASVRQLWPKSLHSEACTAAGFALARRALLGSAASALNSRLTSGSNQLMDLNHGAFGCLTVAYRLGHYKQYRIEVKWFSLLCPLQEFIVSQQTAALLRPHISVNLFPLPSRSSLKLAVIPLSLSDSYPIYAVLPQISFSSYSFSQASIIYHLTYCNSLLTP